MNSALGQRPREKPTPDNTIHVSLQKPVAPQKFARPVKFFVGDVVDRAGNAQPMLITSARGEFLSTVFPRPDIVREALESLLNAADMLSPDAASADMGSQRVSFPFSDWRPAWATFPVKLGTGRRGERDPEGRNVSADFGQRHVHFKNSGLQEE